MSFELKILKHMVHTFSYIIILTYEDQIYMFYYFINTYVATLSISVAAFVHRKIYFSVLF